MGLFEHWPYTNFHELNLNWIICKIKELAGHVDKLQAEVDQIEGGGGEITVAGKVAPAAVNSATLARMCQVIDSYRQHNDDLVYMHKPNPQFDYATGEQANGKFYGYSAMQYPNAPTYGYCGSNHIKYTDDQGNDRQGLAINCSTFALLVALGIPYEWTTYNPDIANTLDHIGKAGYCFNPWKDWITAANVEDYYNTERLYKHMKELGYAGPIDPDWHNVKPGSMLWCTTDDSDEGINHCAICMAVGQIPNRPNSSDDANYLICEVGNWPYPVHLYWYSIKELKERGFGYCALPDYGDTLPFESEVIWEQSTGSTTLQIKDPPVSNGEIITLDFDYTPSSLNSYVTMYVNNHYPKGNNRPESWTIPVTAAEIGLKRHITMPVPIQLYGVHTTSPEPTITSLEIICHGETATTNNTAIENMVIYRGMPCSNVRKPYVIYADSETDMVDKMYALVYGSNRNHGHDIPVIIAPTTQFDLDSNVTMGTTQVPAVLHVFNSTTARRFVAEFTTYSFKVFIKHDGTNYAVTKTQLTTP